MSYLDREAVELEDNKSHPETHPCQKRIAIARSPGIAITPEQEQLIRSHLESGDIPAAQQVVIDSLDEWSTDNPPFPGLVGRKFEFGFQNGRYVPTRELRPMTWSTGTIRVFFPEKGYGFIKPNCGGLDVWFHIQDRANKEYFPREGESLTYLTRLGTKGTLVAKQWSELPVDMISTDMKGDLRWANDQFERSLCGLTKE